MNQNWKGPLGPVTMKFRDGRVAVFETIEAALSALGRRAMDRVVERFPGEFCPYRVGDPVILLDACGMIIPIWKLRGAWAGSGAGGICRRPSGKGMPVPGTGRHHGGHFYRRPKTRAELRDHAGLDADAVDCEEFPLRLRARARRRCIPTAWDDLTIHEKGRNWKAFRRTRWKQRDRESLREPGCFLAGA